MMAWRVMVSEGFQSVSSMMIYTLQITVEDCLVKHYDMHQT